MIFHVEKDHIPEALYVLPVVIYGGRYMGTFIHRLLSDRGVKIVHIIDDNENLQGKVIGNAEIISLRQFVDLYKGYDGIAVVLGTIYGKPVIKNIETLANIQIYEMYEWYNGVCELNQQLDNTRFNNTSKIKEFYVNLQALSPKWADDESRRVIAAIREYVDRRNLNSIIEVSSPEEQYFIPEVIDAISHLEDGLKIIDGGACEGELIQSIRRKELPLEKWYCFETDQANFKKLLYYRDLNHMQGKQICINKGLWNSEGNLYFEGGHGTASRIVDYETKEKVSVTSIDSYFHDMGCNFIKMDIEGAEYNALTGGIHTIKRDRPIMVISIYHSLDDFWRIPQYLMDSLDAYQYYVRHHSMVFCETVLYAIPERD